MTPSPTATVPGLLSFVIPLWNEEASLSELHAQITAMALQHGYDIQIVFVDDGSTDASWKRVQELAAADPNVEGIRFRRNFGKAAALSAGFAAARGDVVFTLDADLQDDPAEVPRFLEALGDDLDVISGWKKVRHDPWHKVIPSRVFNGLVRWLTGVKLHDHNCGFKCYRRRIFEEVQIYGELHRFVPVLAAARGWRVGEVVVNHRPREFGKSKYGFGRFVKGFLDLMTVYFLTGYNHRPQHLFGTMGILAFLAGMVGTGFLSFYWVLSQFFPDWGLTPLHQRPALLYSVGAMLLGAQFLSIGFLAELMTAYNARASHLFSVRDRLGPRSEGVPVTTAAVPAKGPPVDPRD